jgi:hypothetical protein
MFHSCPPDAEDWIRGDRNIVAVMNFAGTAPEASALR